ncbi:MAG TPA: sigma-54 dependent transcriptional regulator [Acidiferrobacteraceae bacterium]|nr:sigma-54 dependent transcriptional regulator [Acidiferrobacteraceae bacterium]
MKRTILIVDDEQNMQTVLRMVLEDAGHQVISAHSGEAALQELEQREVDVVLSDLKMPGMGGEELVRRVRAERPDVPVIVMTAYGTIRSAVQSIHAGAADYLTKPFEPEALEIAVHNALKLREILRENQQLREAAGRSGRSQLLGTGTAAQRLLEEIRRVAPFKSNVLITGESGTGKELVARTIHDLGPRRDHPWVAINCSAIPHELLESELFGHVRGAFSGATQTRVGRIEQARGGTLFLDEIGDLDLTLQAKLLRVLQEREFSRLGSNQVLAADIRLLAATNRDLKALVLEGHFREDLFYRLDVYNIHVPPLRERSEDVPLLATTFLQALARDMDRPAEGFTPAAMALLRAYSWPGNIRELRNAVERALLSARGPLLGPEDLPQALLGGHKANASATGGPGTETLDEWLTGLERQAILEALAECSGVQAQAARRLGVSERSLWHRIKKLGIQVNKTVQPAPR